MKGDALLEAFESGVIDPAVFRHRAHVEVAAAMLLRTDFLRAAQRYQRGVERLAERVGAPRKASLTITLAFLAIIAERLESAPANELIDANPELMDSALLRSWYSPARLALPAARSRFLMPDRAP
jgi:hypothetical protein